MSGGRLGRHDNLSLADFQSLIERFGEPWTETRFDHEPIDDDFDIVPHLTVEPLVFAQRNDLPIDASSHETLLQKVVEQIPILALLTSNEGREQSETRSVGQLRDARQNLFSSLRRDLPPASGAKPLTDPSVKHAQVVVDFGDRADRRTRIVAGRFLRN